jgi:hypothetical protein
MTMQFATIAAITTVVGASMIRLGLRRRLLVYRHVRRCASCGRRLTTRVCTRCNAP